MIKPVRAGPARAHGAIADRDARVVNPLLACFVPESRDLLQAADRRPAAPGARRQRRSADQRGVPRRPHDQGIVRPVRRGGADAAGARGGGFAGRGAGGAAGADLRHGRPAARRARPGRALGRCAGAARMPAGRCRSGCRRPGGRAARADAGAGRRRRGRRRARAAGGAPTGWRCWTRPRPARCRATWPTGLPVVAIRYTPDEACFYRGEDPLHLLRQLPDLLALRIAAAHALAAGGGARSVPLQSGLPRRSPPRRTMKPRICSATSPIRSRS